MSIHDSPRGRRQAVLTSPLLRKSAPHQKSRKARRRHDKVDLRKQWGPQKPVYPQWFLSTPLSV